MPVTMVKIVWNARKISGKYTFLVFVQDKISGNQEISCKISWKLAALIIRVLRKGGLDYTQEIKLQYRKY